MMMTIQSEQRQLQMMMIKIQTLEGCYAHLGNNRHYHLFRSYHIRRLIMIAIISILPH